MRVALWLLAVGVALAQPPAPSPFKPKVKVGATEEKFKTLELAPGTYVAIGLSCADQACTATVNGSSTTIPGTVDFSTAQHTIVAKTGTTPPATCTVGEWFFDTDEMAGANLKICVAANTWQNLTTTYIPAYTVATLPAAGVPGRLAVVTDAAATGSCAFGNGIALALCRDSGSGWVPLGDGGNGGSATSYITFPGANCQYGVAGTGWTLPISGAASPVCIGGTNVVTGALQFADSATMSAQTAIQLMGIVNSIDISGYWRTTATTGNVVWQLQTACVADGEALDPVWNAAQTITDAAAATANAANAFSLTGLTITGCATGETMFIRLLRDPAHASDTIGAAADLLSLTVTINR